MPTARMMVKEARLLLDKEMARLRRKYFSGQGLTATDKKDVSALNDLKRRIDAFEKSVSAKNKPTKSQNPQ